VIGLDTNVLVRFLVRDDAAMAERAEHAIRERCSPEQPGFINHIVLCELAWVLERAYDYQRADVASVLDALCRATDFRVEATEVVRLAIIRFAAGRADFADYLVGLINQAATCLATLTFDRHAAEFEHFWAL
jgi:predicted nucleic-acid-binding protein